MKLEYCTVHQRQAYPSYARSYITSNADVFYFHGHQLLLYSLTYKLVTEKHNELAFHSLGQVFNVFENRTNLQTTGEESWLMNKRI